MSATLPPNSTPTSRPGRLRVSPGTRQPLVPTTTTQDEIPSKNMAARMAVRAGAPSQTMVAAPEAVLIVDDNADDTQRMIEILTTLYPRNLRLYHRKSGHAALETLRRVNLDVIFVGYHLSDMDGTELISQAAEVLEDTAMILLGGTWDGPHTAAAMKSGARDYLDKSRMDAFLVREVIESALRSVRIDYRLMRTTNSFRSQNEARTKQMEALSINMKSTLIGLEQSLRELRTSAQNLTVWELDEQIGMLEGDLRASRDMVGQLGQS